MLSIILVVYKTDKTLLKKILSKINKKTHIIIIDNSYNYDFSIFELSNKTKIIRSKNVGNGAGINIGLKKCKTKYALYLDIDAVFKKEFINDFFTFAKKVKDFTILIPNHTKKNYKNELVDNYSGEGAVLLFNIKKLKKIGFYDEKYFLYFEETDLFLRCKKNDLKTLMASKFRIKHNRASSTGSNIQNLHYIRSWHYMWSMFYYYKKNFGFIQAINETYVFIIKDFMMMILYLFLCKKDFMYTRFFRLYGMITSILNIKSYLRP
tara:strand:+ start:183 stop:977 length:795 start_codon:yes stop_codon:yes gene_type:complete